MKYSFMSFSCPDLTLPDMLALAKRLGYDAVEPRLQSKHVHGIDVDATPAQRREFRDTVARAGVPLCCLATSCRYADPATSQDAVDFTRLAVDLAGDLGVPCIRVFGGAFPQDSSRDAAVTRVSQALRTVADAALRRGVTLCLETHDAWCHPHDVVRVMETVNHPAIAVNWDIMHPVRTAKVTMDEAFTALRPWIRHVHFHDGGDEDGKFRLLPIGQGIVDHHRALQLLAEAGYNGYLSGEWIGWEPYEVHLPRELATMKAYEASR
jgi:sugar phosphate isomerase/epimerase